MVQRQFSAGGAVYKKSKIRNQELRILWLLIQPKRGEEFYNKIRWQLPKGWIEEGEKSEQAAVREVEEEGGVVVKIVGKIDLVKIFFKNTFGGKPEETVFKTITFFLMEYQSDSPSGFGEETERAIWLPFEEAKEKLTFKSEKQILAKAKKMLEAFELQSTLF